MSAGSGEGLTHITQQISTSFITSEYHPHRACGEYLAENLNHKTLNPLWVLNIVTFK